MYQLKILFQNRIKLVYIQSRITKLLKVRPNAAVTGIALPSVCGSKVEMGVKK